MYINSISISANPKPRCVMCFAGYRQWVQGTIFTSHSHTSHFHFYHCLKYGDWMVLSFSALFSFLSFMSLSALLEFMMTVQWSDVVLQARCVGVSFEDSLLSTLPFFLCHTMGFLLLFIVLLIRYAWMSNLWDLWFLSASTELFSCHCACLVITCLFPP